MQFTANYNLKKWSKRCLAISFHAFFGAAGRVASVSEPEAFLTDAFTSLFRYVIVINVNELPADVRYASIYSKKKREVYLLTPIGLFCEYYMKYVLSGGWKCFLQQAQELQYFWGLFIFLN